MLLANFENKMTRGAHEPAMSKGSAKSETDNTRRHVIAGIATLLSCVGGSGARSATAPKSESMIAFTDFVPSPDGKVVAFEYGDRSLLGNHLGIGLLEWQ